MLSWPGNFRLLRTRLLIALVAVAMSSGAIRALMGQTPDYVVQQWTVADGLPSSNVHGLARSSDGFLWISTDKGLARFDGAQFSTVTSRHLTESKVSISSQMVVGPDSQIYMATDDGLTILNAGVAKTVVPMGGPRGDSVQVVLAVGTDDAWFGTFAGYLYHYHNGVTEVVDRNRLSGKTVFGLAQTPNGTLWVGTSNGLFLLANGHVARYSPRAALPINGFFDLAVTDKGRLFAATDRGVLQIEGDTWRFWGSKDGLPSDNVLVLTAAPGDALWIGTTAGLARLAEGNVRTIQTPSCSVGGLNFDRDDSLWVGCEFTGGILHVTRPNAQLLSAPTKTPAYRVGSIVENKAGVAWAGTLHGLVKWENNHFRLYTMKDGLPSDEIYSISLAPDDSVWIATTDGFARLHEGKLESLRTQEPGRPDYVYSILEDRTGTLWVGTPKALLRRSPSETKLQAKPVISASIWSIREDRNGGVWVSTGDKGLFRVSGASVTHFTNACGPISDDVRDTLEDEHGDIWAATRDGLSRIRNGKCATLNFGDGTQKADIDSLASDQRGRLWLRLPDAVLSVDLAEADRVLDQGGNLASANVYGADDGFRDRLLHVPGLNSVIRHSSGQMWFAISNGIGTINPSALASDVYPLKPKIISFSSDVGEHDLTLPVSVEPGDLRLQLAFTAPTMNGASTLEFRYKLVGFDTSWRPGGKEREAVYTSLPPGRYQFLASVRRPFGTWIDASTDLDIYIMPHFYQTWWWYAVLATTMMATVFIAYQFRLTAIRRQFATLMAERLRERSRLARELHDTLAQGMLGIHFQIEAAQVLLDVDPQSVRKHLENVGRIAREASIETRKSIAELRSDESQNPSPNVVLLEAAFHFARSSTIDLTTDISDDLPRFSPEVMHEISRFVEEALANVSVHSRAQHAYLTAHNSKETLVLSVADDGRGFSVDASKSRPNHFGLTGMIERASRINGSVHIASDPGKGTSITLEVPFRARWNRSFAFLYLSRIPIVQRLFNADR